jgi:hypothetical protein
MSCYAFVPLVLVVAIGAALLIAMWLEHRTSATRWLNRPGKVEAMLYRFCFLDANDSIDSLRKSMLTRSSMPSNRPTQC